MFAVKTILSDTDLTYDVAGMIVVLEDVPPVRNLESIPKVKKEKIAEVNQEDSKS